MTQSTQHIEDTLSLSTKRLSPSEKRRVTRLVETDFKTISELFKDLKAYDAIVRQQNSTNEEIYSATVVLYLKNKSFIGTYSANDPTHAYAIASENAKKQALRKKDKS